jgi:hypothetical protein
MTGEHLLSTRAFGVIAVINLAVGAWAASQFGAMGAAASSALASLCGAAYCAWALHRRTGLNSTAFNASFLKRILGGKLSKGVDA